MNKKLISMIGAVALGLCAVIGGVVFTAMDTNATGTQITVSVESPTVENDEEIKVTVNASSGEAMSYIKADLAYNSDVLELVATSTDLATGADGEIHIIETLAYGETERSYELTFKALEVGSAELYLHDAYIELYESLELVNVSESTTPIEVTVNTSVSEDARIKEVLIAGVQNLDKKFNPDVYEYNLEVGMSMEMFFCSVIPMEEDSVIVAPDDLTLDMGQNRFEILVTAPAGNQQTYVFNINRLDHELEPETEVETETESETAIETEAETVVETETETVIGTEAETVIETEAETIIETETETAAEEPVAAQALEEETVAEPETLGTELLGATE